VDDRRILLQSFLEYDGNGPHWKNLEEAGTTKHKHGMVMINLN